MTTVQKPYAPSCAFTLLFDTCPLFFFFIYFKYDRKRPESKFIPVLLLLFRLIKLILAISHEKKLPTSSLSSGQENGWKSPRSIRWTVSEEQNLNMTPRWLLLSCVTSHKILFRLSSVYKKILKSNLGDNFYIRTHFDHDPDNPIGLGFTRGEVFRVVDTMHRGKIGSWLAIRMGNDLHEMDKGTIPNQIK